MIPQDWDYKKKGSLGDLAVILGSKAGVWSLPFLYVPKRIGTKEICEERQRNGNGLNLAAVTREF